MEAALAALVGTTHLDQYEGATKETNKHVHLVYILPPKRTSLLTQLQANYTDTVATAASLDGAGNYMRRTKVTGTAPVKSDVTLINLRRPDLTTFDGDVKSDERNFRLASALWEVKVNKSDAPESGHNNIIGQIADSVRLRIASCPFQLFTVALVMCDTRFWVSMWDRDGAVISKGHHYRAEQELFLRVIISLHCKMNLYDFGLDPNVKILKGVTSITPQLRMEIDSHLWDVVENIFQSTAALGRCTSVWLITRVDDEGNLIERAFKWSWGADGRLSELEIHALVAQDFADQEMAQPSTIATTDLLDSQNGVVAGASVNIVISTHQLRTGLSPSSAPIQNSTLNRLLLKRVGKSVCSYSSDLELLVGAHDILEGTSRPTDVASSMH